MAFDIETNCNLLQSIVGNKLLSLCNAQYFYNEEPDEKDVGQVELLLSSNEAFCFDLDSDGESVSIRKGVLEVPESFDLSHEAKASWERNKIDLTLGFIDVEITSVFLMIDRYLKSGHEVVSGFKLLFSNKEHLIYFNNGDEASLLINQTPPCLSKEIETKWLQVKNITSSKT